MGVYENIYWKPRYISYEITIGIFVTKILAQWLTILLLGSDLRLYVKCSLKCIVWILVALTWSLTPYLFDIYPFLWIFYKKLWFEFPPKYFPKSLWNLKGKKTISRHQNCFVLNVIRIILGIISSYWSKNY